MSQPSSLSIGSESSYEVLSKKVIPILGGDFEKGVIILKFKKFIWVAKRLPTQRSERIANQKASDTEHSSDQEDGWGKQGITFQAKLQ